MNKPYFCRNFFLTDWRHKRLKNTIDLLLFYEEHLHGSSESEIKLTSISHEIIRKPISGGTEVHLLPKIHLILETKFGDDLLVISTKRSSFF